MGMIPLYLYMFRVCMWHESRIPVTKHMDTSASSCTWHDTLQILFCSCSHLQQILDIDALVSCSAQTMNQYVAAVYVEVILSPLDTGWGDQEELWPPLTKDWASCISSGCIHKMAQLLIHATCLCCSFTACKWYKQLQRADTCPMKKDMVQLLSWSLC